MIKTGVLSQAWSACLPGITVNSKPLESDQDGFIDEKAQTSGTISPFIPPPDEKENVAPMGYYVPRKENRDAIWTVDMIELETKTDEDRGASSTPAELENKSDEDRNATWTPDGESNSDEEKVRQQTKDTSMTGKRPTYRQMIAQALLSKENKQMSDDDICDYMRRFLGGQFLTKRAKALVRRELVQHSSSFKRVPSTLPGKIWTLHPEYEVNLMKNAVKDVNGGWKLQSGQRKEDSCEDRNAIWTVDVTELETKSDEDRDATWTPDSESNFYEEKVRQQTKDTSMTGKRPTYRQMIAQALLSKENKQMSDDDICEYIRRFLGGLFLTKRAKALVRRELIQHSSSFKRVPSTLPGKIWTLHPEYEVSLMKNAVKDANGGWKLQSGQRKPPGTKKLTPTARSKLLPAKFKCRLCECLQDDLTSMKQHIIENHGNQQSLRPKMHKDNIVKQRMYGNVETADIISDMDVRSLSFVVRLCPTCNMYIAESGGAFGIARHLNIHSESSNTSNYACSVCGQQFETRKRYQEHKKYKHAPESVFKCKHCRQFFVTSQSRNDHISKVHPRTKDRQCEVCGTSFRTLTGLYDHLAIHMAVKPFQCAECGKGFAKKTNLDSHRRLHTGERPYRCDFCAQAYTHNVSLKMHKKKIHGIDMWAK